ncbi:MAG: hypothetical protein MUF06_05780 [Pirellulaceae bacterium]|jgi:hypothetical protein|nr:hypothetical protein [Pirellulaceae bacterium]
MPIQITWKRSPAASALHAADCQSRGLALADPRLSEAMGAPTARLKGAIEGSGSPPGRLWRHLAGLAGRLDSPRQIAEVALAKTIGRGNRFEATVGTLADCLAAVLAAQRSALPSLDDELAMRERPLREQWEARGPGILTHVAQLTEAGLYPEQAEVLLVHPALGGGGAAHLPYNSVRIEAVLANPHADLPEAVRLAWLLAQLNLDLPAYSEEVPADRLPHVARLAMLPAVLLAAEQVELVRGGTDLIPRAIQAWHIAVPPGFDVAGTLPEWWETYTLDKPPFRVALHALDQMLADS